MDSMECVSDEGPAEHALVWIFIIAACLVNLALVIIGLIAVFS